MKICEKHWKMMLKSISDRGMGDLIAKDAETAMQNTVAQLNGEQSDFDPAMSMHWHWSNAALKAGGLYLMTLKEDGTDYCPVCEYVVHVEDFKDEEEIGIVADQMAKWCREQKLIPQVS